MPWTADRRDFGTTHDRPGQVRWRASCSACCRRRLRRRCTPAPPAVGHRPAVARPSPAPAVRHAAQPPAPVPRWLVAKAVGPVVAYAAPLDLGRRSGSASASSTSNGYPTVFLVRSVRQVGGATWYDVWLPIRPNESHGWVKEGSSPSTPRTAKIVIDLSQRTLSSTGAGSSCGTFPVAVGSAAAAHADRHLLHQPEAAAARRPAAPTACSPWASAPSSPSWPNWPQGGPVAIHGTNEDCAHRQGHQPRLRAHAQRRRARGERLVPTGSPVVIVK